MPAGPAWTVVKKALRVRRKMFALARSKENALRELAGYPPIRTWWENCYGGCMATIRVTICRNFCPCFLGRMRFKAFFCPRTTCCGRCFYEGDYENEVLKNTLGFIMGAALTLLFYAWLCLQKDYPRLQAAVISCVLGMVLTLGLAFAHTVRCLVFLTIPSMFSKKGRSFLLVYAAVLVFSYPASNISTNLKIMADSSTCGQSLMMNETKKLMDMAADPLSAVIDSLQEMYENIKGFAQSLLEAFKALIRAVKEILSAIAAVFKWLLSLVDICNDTMGAPYRKCKKAFDDAYDDCCDRLGFFKFLCGIVSAASNLCELARIGELLCAIAGVIKDLVVDTVKKATVGTITDLKQMFWFEINIDRHFSYTMNQSRSYTEVKDAIMAEITAAVSGYSGILSVVDNVMMVTVFYVFVKAWRYRRGYLTKDSYDNYYITQQVYAIDERRKEMGKPTVFPLKALEQVKYITLFSRHLTRKEARKMLKGVAFWFLGAYNAGFYIVTDYGLYWLLGMVSRHLNVKTSASVPPFMQLHVAGEGPLADMYRTMVGLLDPLAGSGLEIDTSSCLPIPSTPDFGAYRTIISLYVICLFLAVGEAYGLRLRRAVASCYYPERERQRAVWLYNQILFKRGSFFKFARRQIRRKYKDDQEIQKMSIRGRLGRQFPILRKLMKMCGYDFKNCIMCGSEGKPKDMDNFSHCGNYGCKAVYCNECYDDLNNVCTLCMNPVDYGDLSDLSEEIDSSEDEEIVAFKKRKAKERRAKAEARRKKRKPDSTMNRFKGLFSLPDPAKLAKLQSAEAEARDPLLGGGKKGDSGEGSGPDTPGKSSTAGSSSSSSSSDSDDKLDKSYQYANKSDIPTSTANETSSDSGSGKGPGRKNRNKNMNWPGRQTPQYETLDIFNVEPAALSEVYCSDDGDNSYHSFTSISERIYTV